MPIRDPDATKPKKKPAPKSPAKAPIKGAGVGTGFTDSAFAALGPDTTTFINLVTKYPTLNRSYFNNLMDYFKSDENTRIIASVYPDFYEMRIEAQLGRWDDNQLFDEMLQRGYSRDAIAKAFGAANNRGPGGGGGGGASRAQQVAAAEAAIRNEAGRLGYTGFGDANIKALAQTVVTNNWTGDQLTDYLVTGAASDWGNLTGGALTAGVDAAKALASKQLVEISDTTARQWAARIASGELDQSGLQSLIQAQAAARYGWAADVINKGITVEDYIAPSRDRIAKELELSAESINMMDPKMLSMVTVANDKGETRLANDLEVIKAARRDERWKKTSNARALTASAAVMLRRYVEGS